MIVSLPSDEAWDAPSVGLASLPRPTADSLGGFEAIDGDSTAAARVVRDACGQYLLVCRARSLSISHGVWCFSLDAIDGTPILNAECEEAGDLNRLSLFAAVRGLEAIDGQGRVSLVSNNRYLIRSLDRALPRWRENDFVWEYFGRKVPVQNADLWRRIDRTLGIHEVTASLIQTTRVSPSPHFGATDPSLQLDDSCPLQRIDGSHSPGVPAPSRGLRRWLLESGDFAPARVRRRGRRAAELAPAMA